MTATTHPQANSVSEAPLDVAFDLSKKSWTVAMTSGLGLDPWVRTMRPGAWEELERLIQRARQRVGLSGRGPVLSCDEAGRDGFWIHRALVARGLANRVVDSASIEVNRRARRTKTDRIDACKLVVRLVRVCLGDWRAWREVRVPTVEAEAARQATREREALVKEQTALINQMRGWLAPWGATLPRPRRGAWWTQLPDWSGAPLAAEVQARRARASTRRTIVAEQLAAIARAQKRAVAPTPADSGDVQRDQGISHAGNRRWPSTLIQLAWAWVRLQRERALTQGYLARFGTGKRARRIGIVAVARKLRIALWRYATTGIVPGGRD